VVAHPPLGASSLLRGRLPLVVLVGAAAVAGAVAGGFKDLAVYQHGGQLVLDGLSPVGARDPSTGLPFTYPPFAAVAMVPLALLPSWLAAAVWTAASVAALAAMIAMVLRAQARPAPGWLVALLAVGAMALEPVWQTLTFGQVNLVLMALVVVDLVWPDRRWSGVLVGLAAGVKLTPLVFVLLLLLVGRRAAAGRALATFAGTVVVGFIGSPSSGSYWTDRLVDPTRVGPPALAHNQSVDGALTRLLHGPPSTGAWIAIAVPVLVAVVVVGAGWWRLGDRVLGTCLAALAMLLVSPVSWSHHWVWAVPVALVLWERSRWAAVAWTAVFVARPMVWLPYGRGREYAWGPVEHVVGNAYLLAAIAVCLWAAVSLASASRGWRNVDSVQPVRIHPGSASRG
jgi:alpha-1,2-mannosyltransferase